MVDYKELVRVLRQQADLYGCLLGTAVAIHLMKQAADAIEELLLENDSLGMSLCECDDLLKKLERKNRRNTREEHDADA